MPSLRHITLAIFLLLFSFASYAQQSRTWTNGEGKSFRGRVVDCDGFVAKFKVDGRSNLFEVPLDSLKESDRRIAILSILFAVF